MRDQRYFEIELSKLIMRCFSEGLDQADLIKGLRRRLEEEERLAQQRRVAARSY